MSTIEEKEAIANHLIKGTQIGEETGYLLKQRQSLHQKR